MSTDRQDPQTPGEDQPAPKQYAGEQRQPGERGTQERAPKMPPESSEGEDENSAAAEQNADYSRASTPAGGGAAGGGQSRGNPGSNPRQGGQPGQQGGQPGQQGGSGKGGSSPPPGRSPQSDKNR